METAKHNAIPAIAKNLKVTFITGISDQALEIAIIYETRRSHVLLDQDTVPTSHIPQ